MAYKSISVIVPAFNASKTIEKCLKSILECDYPNNLKEVIVVDNNSSDNTKILIQNFPVILIQEKNQGRSFARNTGAKHASGEILVFIDSDCTLEHNWLSEINKSFQGLIVGAISTPIIPIQDNENDSLGELRFNQSARTTYGTHNLLEIVSPEFPMINSASCSYQNIAFKQVGGFDTSLERHEDIDLSRRIFNHGFPFCVCDTAISYVYWHDNGWMPYIKRSFLHGKHLVDYEKKWSQKKNLFTMLIHYIFSFLFKDKAFNKNIYKTNLKHTLIDQMLQSVSCFSYIIFWFFRLYKAEDSSLSSHFQSELRLKHYKLAPNVNYAILENRIVIKNIVTNHFFILNEILYFIFLQFFLQDSENLEEKIINQYNIKKDLAQTYINNFFNDLAKHNLIIKA